MLALLHCRWHMLASGNGHDVVICNGHVLIKGFRFAEKIMKAAKGETGIVEPTYIYLPGVSGGDAIAKEVGVDYFSVPVELGVRRISISLWRTLLIFFSVLRSRKSSQHPLRLECG